MDGNGRWALERGLSRVHGHKVGVEVVRPLVEACIKNDIKILSLFAFSSENWSRPADEVEQLMSLFIEALDREIDALAQQGVRLHFTGERLRLPSVLQTAMRSVEAITEKNQQLTLNIVVNYGGRWDIVQATKKIAEEVAAGEILPDAIDDGYFETKLNLYPISHPDLIIRTGGELRISNFFLWQAAYSELYFTDIYWPEFTVSEFEKALNSFAVRQRRFGKISDQVSEVNHV